MNNYALLLLLPLAGTLQAQQLDIDLRTGEHVFGTLISQDHDQVVVERSLWRHRRIVMTANFAIPRTSILTMQEVVSLEDDYRAHLAASSASPVTYAARYDLARWCLDHGLVAHALDAAQQLLADDPTDAVTLQLIDDIGYIRDGSGWCTREDYAARHHLVDYAGTMMSPAEAEARTTYSATWRQIQDSQQRIADLQSARVAITLELRDATVALKRAERHQKEARDAAEEQRLRTLTPDQIEDEKEAHRFNAAYHIDEPTPPDTKELLDARKDFDQVNRHYEQVVVDLASEQAQLPTLTATRDAAAAQIARLSGRPFPPVVTAGLQSLH